VGFDITDQLLPSDLNNPNTILLMSIYKLACLLQDLSVLTISL
jgi:hypothetical protein